jgi:hypothetical protein
MRKTGNKFGTADRREYKRLWMRAYRAKIYAARTEPLKKPGRKPKAKTEREDGQSGA